jgi:hypothetical protein
MKEVFPAFYEEIEQAIVARARRRRDRYAARPKAGTKLRALDAILERASQTTLEL